MLCTIFRFGGKREWAVHGDEDDTVVVFAIGSRSVVAAAAAAGVYECVYAIPVEKYKNIILHPENINIENGKDGEIEQRENEMEVTVQWAMSVQHQQKQRQQQKQNSQWSHHRRQNDGNSSW